MTMTRNGWIRLVPRPELNLIHHALRMLVERSNIDDQTRDQAVLLADLLWSELTTRREEASTS